MDISGPYCATIDGRRVETPQSLPVIDPATGEAFAQAPDCDAGHLDEAVAAARRAFRHWKAISSEERDASCTRPLPASARKASRLPIF